MSRRLALIVLLLGAVPTVANAQVAIPRFSADRTESPYFEVEGGAVDRLPLERTDVDVHVSGVIASVVVRQLYTNDGDRPVHAKYVFPASTRAAVSGMRMRIGHRVVEAVIRERQRARKEFEQAKREGKSAALLEEQRPNVFEMGVANVLPGDRIEVELRYTELLVPTDGTYEFVYPTVVGPRYVSGEERAAAGPSRSERLGGVDDSEGGTWAGIRYAEPSAGTPSRFDISVTLSAGMDIRALDVPSHEVRSSWADGGSVEVELDDDELDEGDRDFILHYRLADDRVASGLLLQEDGDERFFALLVQPPRRVTPEHVPPRDFVFLLDVSGSMSGFPLETAKELLSELVGELRPSDYFNVMTFAGGSELLDSRPLSADAQSLSLATDFIEGRHAGGGTELKQAIERAMRLPRSPFAGRTLVLITDGYVTAEDAVFRHIRENLELSNVFAFGIGSSVNRHLIEGVARAGLGEPFVVTDPSEAGAAADRFRRYVNAPVLTDVQLTFEGFDAYDIEPGSLPDLFADRPLVIHGKWRGAPRGRVVVSGRTGHGLYRQAFAVEGIRTERNDALSHLWARTRITNLSDRALSGTGDGVRQEITSLGLHYGLLTRYTSFVAVDRVVRTDARGVEVDQPSPTPAGVESAATARNLQVGPEPELWILLALVTALLLWSGRHGRTGVVVRRSTDSGRPIPSGSRAGRAQRRA